MPVYVYKCPDCGNTEELIRTIAQRNAPACCGGCDAQMQRDVGAEMVASTDELYQKPVLSDALGCHPSQIAEEVKLGKQKGLDLNFTSDGRLIIKSHNERKKILKHYGFYDRDGYN